MVDNAHLTAILHDVMRLLKNTPVSERYNIDLMRSDIQYMQSTAERFSILPLEEPGLDFSIEVPEALIPSLKKKR